MELPVEKDPEWASTVSSRLKKIAKKLPEIKHWQVRHGSYDALEDIEATWFIDPPYQHGGHYYRHSDIDYPALAEWVQSRRGQVIVCENNKADWLPFTPLKSQQGQRYKTVESVWTNEDRSKA